ncbi:hypothetical protein C2G38_2173265 [Gigaspora rosea]|uniref:Orc1-like AAA ATPase domain-containing protein n=1 Tax=Gigaspora rosea TaxID=44941 RepID=A0A397VUN1_9GLOM|nr:hypothetical protein C2G38_2173265 [Gigaspora rosea]
MVQGFHRSMLSSQLVTRKVLLSQLQKFVINSNPALLQSSLLRSYTSPLPSPQEDSSRLNKFANATDDIIGKLVVAGVIGLISVDLLYASYQNRRNEYILNETVEKGTRPDVRVSGDKLIPRPKTVEHLKKVLQPYEDQSLYYVVCGEHGTGKTTLTRIASREVGQGVIYIDVPANFNEFGAAFGKVINFAFEEQISITKQLGRKILGITKDKPENSEWERAMEAFKRASTMYKAKRKKPPVIVYDNDDAKDNADDRKYIAVFVSSEGLVPSMMESRSAWLRATKPVMEIGDLNKEKSIEYLIKKWKINEVEAEKLYDLSILNQVERKFKTAQLCEDQQLHEVGKRVINALLNSKELRYLEFRRIFKSIAKAKEFDPDEMLEKNVFAYHPEKHFSLSQ